MKTELFDIPENKSPRILWMERHHLKTDIYHDESDNPRIAVLHGMTRIANGLTVDEALVNAAKSLNIKLWNEQ